MARSWACIMRVCAPPTGKLLLDCGHGSVSSLCDDAQMFVVTTGVTRAFTIAAFATFALAAIPDALSATFAARIGDLLAGDDA